MASKRQAVSSRRTSKRGVGRELRMGFSNGLKPLSKPQENMPSAKGILEMNEDLANRKTMDHMLSKVS
jgi:hypothetical protein